MKKEEIIDLFKYIDSENLVVKPSTYSDIAESYLSIISTRRSERRADGSNSKAKEVCVHPYKYVRFDLGRKKHYCHKCRCYLKQTD